ncbi:MAG: hypothetical protein AB7L66_23010 [Gemmatimonadales bacterium]
MLRNVLTAVVLSSVLLADAAAQSTATPVFMAPYRSFNRVEFGASLSDNGPGVAVEGFYRFGQQKYDVGFRGGFADVGSNTQFLLGVDFRTRVLDHTEDFPLDGAFTVGVGGSFGDGFSQGYIPVGLTLGRRVQLEDSNTEFIPYLHPVLGPRFGDGGGDLIFGLGLGVDISLNRRFDVRVAGALGDYDGVSVSLAFLR